MKVLSHFMPYAYLSIWKCDKAFSSFYGKDINAFIISIPQVTHFIETNFSAAEHLIYLDKVMEILKNIQELLHKVTANEATYIENLSTFIIDTKKL